MAADPSVATEAAMRWSDWIALLGAAAWLPHLLRLLKRPKVSLVVGNPIEVGFTGLGAILNPTIAFRTQHRDSMVTGIKLTLTHENGQRFDLAAIQTQETSGVTQSLAGDAAMVHQRNQTAIAIVLTPTTIAERKLNSHQPSHRKTLDQRTRAYMDAVLRVQAGPADQWYDRARATPEHAAARSFMRDAFQWQAGTYSVLAQATVDELRSPARATFSFTLTPQDVDRLRRNFDTIDLDLNRMFCEVAGIEEPRVVWSWVYKWGEQQST